MQKTKTMFGKFGKLKRLLGVQKQQEATTEPEPTLPATPRTQQSDSLGEDEREAMLMIACGQKGIGKTVQSKKEMKAYIKAHGRPVIIFDTNDEYVDIKPIDPKDLKRLKKAEIRRVRPMVEISRATSIEGQVVIQARPMSDVEKQEMAKYIMLACPRTMVVLEDYNAYAKDTREGGLDRVIVNNRQRSQDLLIHLQSLARVDTIMFQNLAVIRFHRIADKLARFIDRVPEDEMVTLGYLYVNKLYKAGKKREFIYIELWEQKLTGINNIEFFEEVCKQYLRMNKDIVTLYQSELNTTDRATIESTYIAEKKREYKIPLSLKEPSKTKLLKEKN